LFIFNKFLSIPHKKIQVQTHRYCFFICYSSNRSINSWIFHELIFIVKISV